MKRTPFIAAVLLLLSLAAGCFLVAPETESPETSGEPAASLPQPAEVMPPSSEAEKRDPVEDHRRTYLNVIKLVVDVLPEPRIKITAKKQPATISKYSEEREITGNYYLTKQGVLPCESGPRTFGWCINGGCHFWRDLCHSDGKTRIDRGRYTLYLAGPSLIVSRADIAKEVQDGGRKLTDS